MVQIRIIFPVLVLLQMVIGEEDSCCKFLRLTSCEVELDCGNKFIAVQQLEYYNLVLVCNADPSSADITAVEDDCNDQRSCTSSIRPGCRCVTVTYECNDITATTTPTTTMIINATETTVSSTQMTNLLSSTATIKVTEDTQSPKTTTTDSSITNATAITDDSTPMTVASSTATTGVTESVAASEEPSSDTQAGPSSTTVAVAVSVTISLIIIITVAVILTCFVTRRKRNKKPSFSNSLQNRTYEGSDSVMNSPQQASSAHSNTPETDSGQFEMKDTKSAYREVERIDEETNFQEKTANSQEDPYNRIRFNEDIPIAVDPSYGRLDVGQQSPPDGHYNHIHSQGHKQEMHVSDNESSTYINTQDFETAGRQYDHLAGPMSQPNFNKIPKSGIASAAAEDEMYNHLGASGIHDKYPDTEDTGYSHLGKHPSSRPDVREQVLTKRLAVGNAEVDVIPTYELAQSTQLDQAFNSKMPYSFASSSSFEDADYELAGCLMPKTNKSAVADDRNRSADKPTKKRMTENETTADHTYFTLEPVKY